MRHRVSCVPAVTAIPWVQQSPMITQRYRLATRLLATGVALLWLGGASLPAGQDRVLGGGLPLVYVAEVDALVTPVSAGFMRRSSTLPTPPAPTSWCWCSAHPVASSMRRATSTPASSSPAHRWSSSSDRAGLGPPRPGS